MLKKILSVIFCLLALSSCASSEAAEVTSPGSYSITIETFGTAQSTSPTASETLPVSETAAPAQTQVTSSEKIHISDTDKPSTMPASTSEPQQTAPTMPVEESALSKTAPLEITSAEGRVRAAYQVNVRREPDADSEKVGYLDRGDEVPLTGFVSNGWVRIIFNDEECYVNSKYLEEIVPSESDAIETEHIIETTPAPETTVEVETEPVPEETEFTETVPDETDPPFTEPVQSYQTGVLTSPNYYTAVNYQTPKAVWFAYLDLDGILANSSEKAFRQAIGERFDNIKNLGCNTVYVHVRPFGDAYYYSDYYPFTAAYYGTLGISAPYDPLSVMIDEAHIRGLSFHAWINPMRTTTSERYNEMPEKYALKQWYNSSETNGKLLVYDAVTKYWWLSPAYSAVRELICNGVSEIVSRYNVDGIHIDDYFYPTTSASFDEEAYEASGWSDLTSWRKSVVSKLVQQIYSTVKACNSTVEFGVSPQGNIDNNRNLLYADIDTWCAIPGYIDYIAPQIYFGFEDRLAFDETAMTWRNMTTAYGVKLICGIAAYKVGTNTEWSTGSMLARQTEYLKRIGYTGMAYYRYDSLYGGANDSQYLMSIELASLESAVKEY